VYNSILIQVFVDDPAAPLLHLSFILTLSHAAIHPMNFITATFISFLSCYFEEQRFTTRSYHMTIILVSFLVFFFSGSFWLFCIIHENTWHH